MNKKRQEADEEPKGGAEAPEELADAELVGETKGNGAAEPAKASADQELVAALKDQLLRLAADFDNFRKRARKEQDEMRRYGIETLLQDVIPVLDNLERALSHSEGDKSPVLQGVRMVQKQLADTLNRYGVQTFATVGKPFDPEKHEAVSQQPSTEKPGTVLQELQRGYMLHERLLRPARVVVASAATKEEGQSAPAAERGD
jgi:molecular chaperone GrpE